jgi:hypothetical protein
MRTEFTTREGVSNAIQFQLFAGTVPINLAGVVSITMYLKDNQGSITSYGDPKIVANGAAGGSVSFTPGTADLLASKSPYRGYFQVYSAPTVRYFVPEDSEFTINVRSKFA